LDPCKRTKAVIVKYNLKIRYYEPVHVSLNNLSLRAESINYVNCHIQEIPENGADGKHFDLVHNSVADNIPFMKFQWKMKTKRPVDPDFKEVMTHWNPKIRAY
jgi:cholesterol 7-dehydrogenase